MTKHTKTKIVVGSVVKAKVGELEKITIANSECMLDLCFCVKGHSNKNIQKSEKSPGR